MPKVYVIPDPSPNAFATGRNPEHAAVAATEGILRMLSEPELEGVIAHELAHVKHRDILISSVAATMAAAIMMVARMAMYRGMFGGGAQDDRDNGANPIALLAMMILAPIAAMLDPGRDFPLARVQRRRRRREHRRHSVRARGRASKNRGGVAPGPARRQSGDGAHVHRQAVLR